LPTADAGTGMARNAAPRTRAKKSCAIFFMMILHPKIRPCRQFTGGREEGASPGSKGADRRIWGAKQAGTENRKRPPTEAALIWYVRGRHKFVLGSTAIRAAVHLCFGPRVEFEDSRAQLENVAAVNAFDPRVWIGVGFVSWVG
jgi:hypothetical protein